MTQQFALYMIAAGTVLTMLGTLLPPTVVNNCGKARRTYQKVGGLHFVRAGRLCLSFCLTRR